MPLTKRKASSTGQPISAKKVHLLVQEDKEERNPDFISDDDTDLLLLSQTEKYNGENSDDYDDEEESDEEISESEANMKDSEFGEHDFESSNSTTVDRSKLYKAPTTDEIRGLNEASSLFKSNIFKMEVEELLTEVRIDYTKMKQLEAALHRLKSVFDEIVEEHDAMLADIVARMKKSKIVIPFPDPQPAPDIQYKFAFKKPSAIHVVGSYPLKTVTRTRKGFNVDVAVEMPASLFQEKDQMNYRYFYKRAYYIACIARAIRNKGKGMGVNLKFDVLNGDRRRPILLLGPPEDKSDVDFTKSKCIIRIIPTIPPNVFARQRLLPSRNNVRPKHMDETTPHNGILPTPYYNNILLEDTIFTSSLAFLYQHSKNCPSFKDAVLLGKVWLHQRGFAAHDEIGSGFNGFLFSMIMGYLLQGGGLNGGKKLANGFSSYQLLKGTIEFLAQHNFTEKPLAIGKSDDAELIISAFQEYFDVVILDPTGVVNLAAGMTKTTLLHLQHEAKLGLQFLNETNNDRFDALFLQRVNDWKLRYDNVARITAPSKPYKTYTETTALDHPSLFLHFTRELPAMLTQALTNRVRVVATEYEPLTPWELSSNPNTFDTGHCQLILGIILDPQYSSRSVDHGPQAEDTEAAEAFHRLWGKKAELRRFKDGSILESVVWDGKGSQEKSLIVYQAVSHLLQLHFGILPRESMHYWAGEFYPFINFPKNFPAVLHKFELTVLEFQPIMKTFEEFSKRLRALENLPLPILNVHGSSAALRYSTVFVPQPQDPQNFLLRPETARFVDPVDVVIEFEGSTKWPDDVAAIQKTKIAFLLKVAEQLQLQTDVKAQVVAEMTPLSNLEISGYMDVIFPPGYVFRCRVRQDREITLLQRILVDKKESDSSKKKVTHALEKCRQYLHYSPQHTFFLQSLCGRFAHLSTTIRIAKRWFSAHLLYHYIRDEVIELFCIHVFTDPHPWTSPASPFQGFIRVLYFLATWDWQNEPLIVDLDGEISTTIRDLIKENFRKTRSLDDSMRHCTMFVASAQDPESKWWTPDRPGKVIAGRVQTLTKAAADFLDEIMSKSQNENIKRLFVTPLHDYDFVIRLDPSKCTRYYENLTPDVGFLRTKHDKFKNLAPLNNAFGNEMLIGFDPMAMYFEDLQRTYGDVALFFHDQYGGTSIAAIWNPAIMAPRQWKVNLGLSSIPLEMCDGDAQKHTETAKGKGKLIVPNTKAILAEIERLGKGLILQIDIK